jgi:hypothetical protein
MYELSSSVAKKIAAMRGFYPVKKSNVNIFKAVMGDNFVAFDFKNKDIRERVYGKSASKRNHPEKPSSKETPST